MIDIAVTVRLAADGIYNRELMTRAIEKALSGNLATDLVAVTIDGWERVEQTLPRSLHWPLLELKREKVPA